MKSSYKRKYLSHLLYCLWIFHLTKRRKGRGREGERERHPLSFSIDAMSDLSGVLHTYLRQLYTISNFVRFWDNTEWVFNKWSLFIWADVTSNSILDKFAVSVSMERQSRLFNLTVTWFCAASSVLKRHFPSSYAPFCGWMHLLFMEWLHSRHI